MHFDVTVNGRLRRVVIDAAAKHPGQVQVSVDGQTRAYDAAWIDRATLSLFPVGPLEAGARHAHAHEFAVDTADAGHLQIAAAGRQFIAVVAIASGGGSASRQPPRATRDAGPSPAQGRQHVVAAMPGRVVRVLVSAGDRVADGQPVAVVEAMKMENELRAAKDGVVREVRVQPGAAIDTGAVVVVID
jgi:glutaconyl-CoA/methylmalonyl-CoA decarboxylase subunit gamma